MTDLDLDTPRLSIRRHTLANLDALTRWNTDPVIHHLSDDDPEPPTAEGVRATLTRWVEAPRPDVHQLAFHHRGTDELVGFGTLAFVDETHGRCMLGLVIGERARWGQGLGREALEGLLRLAFERLRLRRVGAQIYAFNARSLRLFEGAGFRREGVLRGNVVKDGVAHDEVVLGLLREEWSVATSGAACRAATPGAGPG